MHKNIEDGIGLCPVCRKVFHAKDIEHVIDLVGVYSQLVRQNLLYFIIVSFLLAESLLYQKFITLAYLYRL